MKLKTTKKQIKNNFNNVYSFGYCQIQNLVYYKNAFAYSSGSSGWSCDYYEIDNVCLSTGYSPTGVGIDYDLVRKYEDKAKKLIGNYDLTHKVRKNRCNKLLSKLINEIQNTKN
jgi:hypothetical protein